MDDTLIYMNNLDLVKDCMCEYVLGTFYSQLTYKVITAFLINDKAIIHTCNGQTIIEYGLEPCENIIKRMKEFEGNDFKGYSAFSIHIGNWEIMALTNENTVHITQK
jgi:hypothetical protein